MTNRQSHWYDAFLIWRFRYGGAHNQTVTVKARFYEEAEDKARDTLDERYEKADMEPPPVAWTLKLESARLFEKKQKET